MSPAAHRDLIAGEVAGLIGGIFFALAMQFQASELPIVGLLGLGASGLELALHLLAATIAGALFGLIFRHSPKAYAALISSGILFGLILWILGPLTLSFVIDGVSPQWALSTAAANFPSLIGHLFYGAILGFFFFVIASILHKREASEDEEIDSDPEHRVVILGGGFGGVYAAKRLGQLFGRDPNVEIVLVSESNYLLFTPMLAEVAAGGLEARHISVPIRAAAPKARFRFGAIEEIDIDTKIVYVRDRATGAHSVEPYDQLVLALGSQPNFFGLDGIEKHSLTLKSLKDAARLREHVLRVLSRADQEHDEDVRKELLSFVVIGGGFAGSETIAELHDLVHGVLRFHPNLSADEVRFSLIHSRDRLLPELGPDLAAYAQSRLEQRGIKLFLEARAQKADENHVLLNTGEQVPTRTIVWTAGNRPHQLIQSLGCETTRAGAAVVDRYLRVAGLHHVWAVGDCAQVPDPANDGAPCPPTAQHAIRQGIQAAENVALTLKRKPERIRPFRYKTQGILVVLGSFTAVAEIMGIKFSGFLAWLAWRTIYLSKLPGLEKKLRVLLDWKLDLFFPRDIALLEGEDEADFGSIADFESDRTRSDDEPISAETKVELPEGGEAA